MKRKPLISTLEPRLLFDGAAIITAIDVLDNNSFDESSKEVIDIPISEKVEVEKKEVIFIDSNVEDYETLVNSFDSNIEVFIINDKSSGINQIASFLENKSNIDSIHIFSHGKIGEINIGNDSLNSSNLNNFKNTLESIGNSLSQNGDILLYGCSISQNTEGKEFVDSLAELTSADILASDDITGDKSLGGDWDLEYSSGDIESVSIVVDNYNGTFADIPAVITPGNVSGNIVEGSGSLSANGSFDYVDDEPAAINKGPNISTPANLISITAVDKDNNPLIITGSQKVAITSGFVLSAGSDLTHEGTIIWNYNTNENDLDFLGAGDILTAIFKVQVEDRDAAAVAYQDITITITGTNDSLSVIGVNVVGDITEGSILTDTGTVTFSDIDLTDRPTGEKIINSITGKDRNGLSLALSVQQKADIAAAFTISPVGGNTNDGTIDWDFTIINDKLDFLEKDDRITAVFTISVSDGEGSPITKDVTITITGITAIPVITPGNVDSNITEGSGNLSDNGSITFVDSDLNDRPIASSILSSLTGLDGSTSLNLTAEQISDIETSFSVENVSGNTNDGTINWNFTGIEENLNFLASGEVLTAVFTITLDDQSGGTVTQDVTITITGVNDSVSITGGDVTGTIVESSNLIDSGSIIFTDSDSTDTHTGSLSNSSIIALDKDGNPLTLTAQQILDIQNAFSLANPNNGATAWTYSISESALDFLGKGEVITAVFTVSVSDGEGSISTQDVTINITGANEIPIITPGNINSNISEGSANLSDNGSLTFTDGDLNDRPLANSTLSTLTGLEKNGSTALNLTAQQISDIEAGFSVNNVLGNTNNGTITWNFSITEDKLRFLAEGEVLTAIFTITVDDQDGGTSTQDVTITITDSNDSVNIIGGSVNASIVESGNLVDSGSIIFTDSDSTDSHTGSLSNNSITGLDKDGNPLTLTAQQILDIQNAFSLANPNNGATAWTYSIAESALDFLGKDEVVTAMFTITVSDNEGSSDTEIMKVIITGTFDVPEIQVVSVIADITEGSTNLSDTGSITFTDVDSNDIILASSTFDSISALAQDGTTPLNLSADEISSIQAGFSVENVLGNTNNGTINWDFSINENELDFLADGEVITVVFTINLDDQSGGEISQDVIVTIRGTNDIPIVSNVNIDEKLLLSESYTQDISKLFSDIDKSNTHNYEVNGLPTGLSYNFLTGVISGKALESGLFNIEIKVYNTKNPSDLASRNYILEVIPSNINDTTPAKEEVAEVIIEERIASVEVNDFVSDEVQGVLDISLKEGSDFSIGKGFLENTLISNSDIVIETNERFTSNESATFSINDDGKVNSSQESLISFDEIGLSIEVTSRIDNFIEMKITDVKFDQRYEVSLSDGSPLPKGITFDEKTGFLKGKFLDNLEVTVKAISSDGTVRTLNIKIEADNKEESPKTSDNSFISLQEQLEQKASNMQGYGKHISSLFSDEVV